jgi:fructose 1,6-bisphosphatase
MTLFLPIYRIFPEMVDAPGIFLVKLTMFSGGKKEVHIFYESNDILVTLSSKSNQKLCLQDLLQNTTRLN